MHSSVPAALAATVAIAAVAPAFAADKSSKPRLAVLELTAPSGGTSGKAKDGHKEEIDIYSVTWGTTRARSDALTDGLLVMRYNQDGSAAVPAGKMHMEDLHAAPDSQAAKVSKVDAFSIKQKAVEEAPAPRANDRLRNAGPRDGWKAATGAEESLTVGGGRTEAAIGGQVKWSDVQLTRGVETSASGGVSVAAGDLTGDGRAASGQATGKRVHKPIRIRTYDAPLPSGSVLLKLSRPWPGCAVGDRFNGAYLVVGSTHRYQLAGATVAGCSANAVAVNYRSIVAQRRVGD